ncbi:hypothetical protein ID866_3539, partial [Astraeus odoratus]
HDNGSHDSDQETVHVETTDVTTKTKHRRQPAAYNRTNDPEYAGQNKAAAIVSRHDQFCDSAGNKAKDNPGDDTHSNALLQIKRILSSIKEPSGVSHYSEQFLKQNPLAVLGVLRDLQKGEVPLRISWSNNQFISKILDVSQERLVIDLGSLEYENRAALKAENIVVMAETHGAKVEFVLPRLELSEYQGLPAFVTLLPGNLWFVQRREYFRISAPLHPAYFCKAKMPDKKEIRFRLFDLSLGGMGALMDTPKPEGLVEGMRFTQIELDMAGWGRFYFDAQLIAISERTVVDSKNETITTPRLSFRFLNVGPGAERELQRIIYSLEREARERANKVL